MSDSIFDDQTPKVGQEMVAYCPSSRCKCDTAHVVMRVYETEIRRVRCLVCNDLHAFRPARGGEEEETEEVPLSQRLKTKPSWDDAMKQVSETDLRNCSPYSVRGDYQELDIITHPKFGVGFITELLPDDKVEITFQDDKRVLIHRRGDLAGKVPKKIASAPTPRPAKGKKRRGKRPPADPKLEKELEASKKARQKAQEMVRSTRDQMTKDLATESLMKTRKVGGKKSARI